MRKLGYALIFLATLCLQAAETVFVPPQKPSSPNRIPMGSSHRPDGATLTVDSGSLRLNGQPWLPVMGEFHFSRYPENEWHDELLKIKAGGIDIVATYVFWIHHEEIEGQFDWIGQRNLRRFVQECDRADLQVIVRCGPWCHGEVRNGGFPDWLLAKHWKTRSDDTNYLAKANLLYRQISDQLRGLLWKDGGPVVGIQLENEYGNSPTHLLTLKRLAVQAGLDVPLYTRTGWPQLRSPMPFGELLPLFGAYAEGFWDRTLAPMPGNYWSAFQFSPLRTDAAIATDILGNRGAQDAPDTLRYPYLTCELGGGMASSYHRRILLAPADVESVVLVKLGSGSDLPGYYMYHGGENPEGKLSTLQESIATGYANDLPVKTYDFNAPLGQYGQIHPQYHSLRRLHLFLRDYGPALTAMPAYMPETRPTNKTDSATLRWAVRSDGVHGLLFVNNYQRLLPMPPKEQVKFQVQLPVAPLTIPQNPLTIPANTRFFWPFNFDLGLSAAQTSQTGPTSLTNTAPLLLYATAQPICSVDDGPVRTVFFSQTPGVPSEFVFQDGVSLQARSGTLSLTNGCARVSNISPGTSPTLTLTTHTHQTLQIVLLDEATSLTLWKAPWHGQPRVFLTRASLTLDGDSLRLASTNRADLTVSVFPAAPGLLHGPEALTTTPNGIFTQLHPCLPSETTLTPAATQLHPAGPLRVIPIASKKNAVAEAPSDPDFTNAATWRIQLPAGLSLASAPLLRIHYTGDVARLTLDGKLITDDFYNSLPMEVSLARYGRNLLKGDLQLAILPLRKNAPILLPKTAEPDFTTTGSIGTLNRLELLPTYEVRL
jgi:hypothetical protein